MTTENKKMNIHQQLREFQLSMSMEKNAKGNRCSYRNIEGIMALAKKNMHNLDVSLWRSDSIISLPDGDRSRLFVKVETALIDGEGIKSEIFCGLSEIGTKAAMDLSQQTGAASTYAHRRALSNLFAIDDGSLDPDAQQPEKARQEIRRVNDVDFVKYEKEIQEAKYTYDLTEIGRKLKSLNEGEDKASLRSLYEIKWNQLKGED
jgi:hypothetical protein